MNRTRLIIGLSVAIVLGTPEPLPSATPPGLPFTLDVTPEATP